MLHLIFAGMMVATVGPAHDLERARTQDEVRMAREAGCSVQRVGNPNNKLPALPAIVRCDTVSKDRLIAARAQDRGNVAFGASD